MASSAEGQIIVISDNNVLTINRGHMSGVSAYGTKLAI
jgi:hypothetical protein